MRTSSPARVLGAILAAGAIAIAVPQPAHAETSQPGQQPCPIDLPDCHYTPPLVQYQAVGRDRDEATAQAEAEQEAELFCARGYKKVKVLIKTQGETTVYTLIYTCNPPGQ